jgi:hypothetical protein
MVQMQQTKQKYKILTSNKRGKNKFYRTSTTKNNFKELSWTDEEAIKARLFSKIDEELNKLRQKPIDKDESLESNDVKSPSDTLKKPMKITQPSKTRQIPSVQSIISIVSINQKLPPNKYNMLDEK